MAESEIPSTPQEDESQQFHGINTARKEYPVPPIESLKLVSVVSLVAWSILRLFINFGDYGYYYGVGYIFDVLAIYILFRISTMVTEKTIGRWILNRGDEPWMIKK